MNPSPFPDYNRPAMTLVDLVADWVLLAGGLGALVFVCLYGFFLNWRETPAGRAILAFVVSLIGVLALVVTAKLTGGDYPLRDVLRLVIYGGVFVTSWRLVVVLVQAWRADAMTVYIPERDRKRDRTGPNPTQP